LKWVALGNDNNYDDFFGIIEEDDDEKDGEALLQFTRDKNSKKHDFIPGRTRKINTERGVVKRPSEKKKQGKPHLRIKIWIYCL
jgi:hypothetical protein